MIYYIFLFILGLAAGSFLNVVSSRYRPGHPLFERETIGGRSHCPHCRKELTWYELIPVFSFVIQKGRCRNCKGKISLEYPLVEILAGLIVAGTPWYLKNLSAFGGSAVGQYSIFSFQSSVNGQWPLVMFSALWIAIFLLFLLLSIIDFRHYLIPDAINLTLGILGLILIFLLNYYGWFSDLSGSFLGHYALLFGLRGNIWVNHIAAVFLGMAVFGAIILLSKGKAMGWGDFKLALAMGFIFGWPDILVVLVTAFVVGALISLPLLIKGKKSLKDSVPFGPLLATGGALVFLFGFQFVDYYFKLFGLY